MARPKCKRNIKCLANASFYKPAGIPLRELQDVVIEKDEMEALRLADKEGMYHEDAARSMGISRQTFGRIVSSARRKIADALINGKAIRIDS